jgi:hypothetical protein
MARADPHHPAPLQLPLEFVAMTAPVRIQRSRAKGWRMPPNTIYVGRPGPWGNPFGDLPLRLDIPNGTVLLRRQSLFAADAFRFWLSGDLIGEAVAELHRRRMWILDNVRGLAGADLACWCRDLMPCHADVLLDLANR